MTFEIISFIIFEFLYLLLQGVLQASSTEAIMNMLTALSPTQLFELMSQMKLLIQQTPDQARQLLYQNPQLAYALLHAQLMIGMVDSSIVQVSLRSSFFHSHFV